MVSHLVLSCPFYSFSCKYTGVLRALGLRYHTVFAWEALAMSTDTWDLAPLLSLRNNLPQGKSFNMTYTWFPHL